MNYLINLFLFTVITVSMNCGSFDAEKNYEVARQLETANRCQEAIETFKKVAQKSKGDLHYKALFHLSRNYYFLDDYESAKQICEDLLISMPDSLDPRLILGIKMVLISAERETCGYQVMLNDWGEMNEN